MMPVRPAWSAELTDGSGWASVLIGFIAARITIGWALLMPASRPPALLLGRVKPSVGVSAWRGIVLDRVVNLGARMPGGLEPQADFHPLDRLHGHDRLGQPAIEFFVPLGVRAQAEGDALDANFDDTAQRVAGPLHLVDELLDLPVLVGIQGV